MLRRYCGTRAMVKNMFVGGAAHICREDGWGIGHFCDGANVPNWEHCPQGTLYIYPAWGSTSTQTMSKRLTSILRLLALWLSLSFVTSSSKAHNLHSILMAWSAQSLIVVPNTLLPALSIKRETFHDPTSSILTRISGARRLQQWVVAGPAWPCPRQPECRNKSCWPWHPNKPSSICSFIW